MQAPINGAVIAGTPSSVKTYGFGINSAGDVVGYYTDLGGDHAFLDQRGTTNPNILEFNYPGVGGEPTRTESTARTRSSAISSVPIQISPGVSTAHGFLYTDGAWSYFDDPNAANGTFAEGINKLRSDRRLLC